MLRNRSDGQVRIDSVGTSCDCVKVQDPTGQIINPDSLLTLSLNYKPRLGDWGAGASTKRFETSLSLICTRLDRQSTVQFEVPISGEIRRALTFTQFEVDLGVISDQESVKRVPIEITCAIPDAELKWELDEAASWDGLQVVCRNSKNSIMLDPSQLADDGSRNFELRGQVIDSKGVVIGKFSVPVKFKVDRFDTSPEIIDVGVVQPSEIFRATVSVVSRDANRWRLNRAIHSSQIKTEVVQKSFDRIQVKVQGSISQSGNFSEVVKLEYLDSQGHKAYEEIPIRGYVRMKND